MNGTMTTDCTILSKLHVCHGYIRKASKKQSKLKASAMKATHVLFIVVFSISYTLIGFAESPGSVSFRINDHHQSPSTPRHPVERTNFLKLVEAPRGPKVATEAVSHPWQNKSTVETLESKRDIGAYMIGGCFLTCQVCFFCLQLITSWILNLSQKESLTFKLEPFSANKGHSLVIVRLRTHG